MWMICVIITHSISKFSGMSVYWYTEICRQGLFLLKMKK